MLHTHSFRARLRTFGLAAGLTLCLTRGDTLVDDCNTIDAWSPHSDGGNPPEILADPDGHTGACLRLVYHDRPPHWGNVARELRLPPEAIGLRFDLRVTRAEPRAALHVWLFEADGDGYVVRLRPENRELRDLAPGWHDVTVLFSSLAFQPRGNGKREFLTVNRMLFGCNFADFDAAIDNLRLRVETPVDGSLPRTEDLRLADGPAGRVAVLAEPTFPRHPSHASPQRLAELLRQAGFGVTLLRAGDVCDEIVLRRPDLDVLIVPCAPLYPRAGREALLGFLRAGGAFVSLGGYAFDELVVPTEHGWESREPVLRAADMDAAPPTAPRINTRVGKPGDTMGLAREQIGVFDPSYELRRAVGLRAAPEQSFLAADWTSPTPVSGFAAMAMTGSNSPVFPDVYGRWVPILQAADRYGRDRGPVLALVHNTAGPFARAAWAFCGVTDQDLFDGRFPALDQALVNVTRRLVRPCFLHGLRTSLSCYRAGEDVRVSVTAQVPADTPARLRIEVGETLLSEQPVAASGTFEASLPAVPAEPDFRPVRAVLSVDGRDVDTVATAFTVWDPETLRKGPAIAQQGNLMNFRGVPTFLCGANQTGMMWYSANEDPLVWQRDFERMNDHGLNLLRILHFSPFANADNPQSASRDVQALRQQPLETQRQTDAIVQLAQRHNTAIFLTLHDWMPVELSDQELGLQRDWARFWVGRYRDVPGMLYDVQNEPSVGVPDRPDIRALAEIWLTRRYGSLDKVRQAWGLPPEAPLPLTLDRGAAWEDLRCRDLDRFRSELFRRWIAANASGVRDAHPEALLTVGFLQTLTAADKFLGTVGLDFTNTHFYGSVADYRTILKLIDRRFEGKSFSLGEFGAREAHDARSHGHTGDPADRSVPYYLAVGHYALGMGASFVACWDWKDFRDCVFPWGVNHADLVPKPVLEAYRNMALLFRPARPRFEPPEVYLLVPDSLRFGPHSDEIHRAVQRAAGWLMGSNVPFGVVNEESLADLPADVRALVWPIPYCPGDTTFDQVRTRVQAGAALLFSGDVRFGENRRPDRPERLRSLGLEASQPPRPPFPVDGALARDPVTRALDKGSVTWVPFPLELDAKADGTTVYRAFLDRARVPRLRLDPDDGSVHAFRVPLEDGDAFVLYNDGGERRTVTLREAGGEGPVLRLELAAGGTGWVQKRADRVVAAESQGTATVDGRPILQAQGHMAVVSLEGEDITASEALLVLPFGPGNLPCPSAALRDGEAVLLVGEFRAGRWHTLDRQRLASPASAPVEVFEQTPFDLRILARPERIEEAIRSVETLLNRQSPP
ncbi:MAG: hypothetical protein JXR77_13960 [Lentisphaeria bacterium]|nr:hypothetical protein [Lentisphaeria bacterium]